MRFKNSKKLNILIELYRASIHPYYIDTCILKNKNERAMLSKLPYSAHKLEIEGGRYLNISKDGRICTACTTGEVGDEKYILPNYSLPSHLCSITNV